MPNLTQVAHNTRKFIKYGIIAVLALIVLRLAYGMARNVWLRLRPPPPPPPTVEFGQLPQINFPERANLPQLTYRLETIAGGLPTVPTTAKVYFMPVQAPSLLALDKAKEKASRMGFITRPRAISDVIYQWRTESEPATTLEININTGHFTLTYPFAEDPLLLAEKNLPTNEQAATEAKKFLQTNGLLNDDLANGRAEFTYYRFAPPNLETAISLSEADFVRVNLFRANLDDLKILPPDPQNALISFLFSGSRERGKRIVEIKYHSFPIETETFATYPLKKIDVAWQELQSGQGYVAHLGENQDGRVTIRQVYLAYFDSDQKQNFLQPVFVFEGDRNFFGYVPAVDPQWIQ